MTTRLFYCSTTELSSELVHSENLTISHSNKAYIINEQCKQIFCFLVGNQRDFRMLFKGSLLLFVGEREGVAGGIHG